MLPSVIGPSTGGGVGGTGRTAPTTGEPPREAPVWDREIRGWSGGGIVSKDHSGDNDAKNTDGVGGWMKSSAWTASNGDGAALSRLE